MKAEGQKAKVLIQRLEKQYLTKLNFTYNNIQSLKVSQKGSFWDSDLIKTWFQIKS